MEKTSSSAPAITTHAGWNARTNSVMAFPIGVLFIFTTILT